MAKYDVVLQNIDFAKELQKQFFEISADVSWLFKIIDLQILFKAFGMFTNILLTYFILIKFIRKRMMVII